jgi:hypothetical protein
MKRKFLLCFLFITGLPCVFAQEGRDYRARFKAEYEKAETMAVQIEPLLLTALNGDAQLTKIGLAVVFPELTRYNILRDTMETTVLELSYMAGNSLDFSIGELQMKTSFAALMEKSATPAIKRQFPAIFINSTNSDVARKNRIKELKTLEGEVKYLAVFLELMNSHLPYNSMPCDYIIKIYATAYNTGYQYGIKQLNSLANVKLFPYGKRHKKNEQYSYYKISLEYWHEQKERH